jgi:hypothetical protein
VKEMERTYEIHDNGGRPFLVKVKDKEITVYKNQEDKEPKKLFEWTVDEVFIGKKSPGGGYDGLKPREAEGNSILVKKGSKYIYIGSEIYEFTPFDNESIEKYYSNIGNSDVPYPYAIGQTYVYLMIEKVAVERALFDLKEDVYQQYYGSTHWIEMCLKGHGDQSLCRDRAAARETMEDWIKRTRKIKKKVLQKRV